MKSRVSEKEFEFRGARLPFDVFVKFFLLMGFFAGLVFAPILAVLRFFGGDPAFAVLSLFLVPAMTAINTGILGLAAYPLYSFLANRYVSFGLGGYVATSNQRRP